MDDRGRTSAAGTLTPVTVVRVRADAVAGVVVATPNRTDLATARSPSRRRRFAPCTSSRSPPACGPETTDRRVIVAPPGVCAEAGRPGTAGAGAGLSEGIGAAVVATAAGRAVDSEADSEVGAAASADAARPAPSEEPANTAAIRSVVFVV
ncbi:hypothetical protein NUM3379_00920 [Kineococcus sp. NUM-3379]